MSSVSPLLPTGLHAGSSAAACGSSIGHQLTNNGHNSLFLNNLANSNRTGDAHQSATNGHHHTLNTLNSLNSLNTLNTLNTLNSLNSNLNSNLNNNLNSNLNNSLESGPGQFANGEPATSSESSASLSNHLTGNTVPTSYFPFPTTGDQASVYSAAAANSLAGNSNSQQCTNWDVALKQSSADYGAANSSYLLNNKLSFQQLSSNGSSYAGSAAFNSNGAITSAAAAAAASNSAAAAAAAANSTYFCLDSTASTFPLTGVTNGSSATHLNNLNNLNQLNLNSNSAQHLDSLGNHLFNPMMHHHSNHQPHSSLNNSLQNSLQNNLHGSGLPNSAVSFDYFTGLNMNSNQSNSNLQANGSSSEQPASSGLESTNGSNNLLVDQKNRIERVE